MPLVPEHREVVDELNKLIRDLNLTEDQARRLQILLSAAHESLSGYKIQNPHPSSQEILLKVSENKVTIRQQAANFLKSEQLMKWDVETARAFLGYKLAA